MRVNVDELHNKVDLKERNIFSLPSFRASFLFG
jgi:hypothetical protein